MEEWIKELTGHPDLRFYQNICNGIKRSFRIGFNRSCVLSLAVANLHCSKPKGVPTYTCREIALHRMWKFPISTKPKGIHISPLGLILTKNKPGK